MARPPVGHIAGLPASVSAPKTSFAYQAHSYPTKVPPEAIVPFIEALTGPNDVVLDPFCGSGMTAVAALQTGRRAILSDLSPGAVHVARGHSSPVAAKELDEALSALDRRWMRRREKSLYGAACPTCRSAGVARHTIWSETVTCPDCETEAILFDHASDAGSIPRSISCERCGATIGRAGVAATRSVPVQITVDCGVGGCGRLQTAATSPEDAARVREQSQGRVRYWLPTHPVDSDREMYKRSALHLKGVETVADFYLRRSQLALSGLWEQISRVGEAQLRNALRFAFTNTAWHSSRMRRYNTLGGQRPLTGTLYIPQLVAEANVFEVFRNQVRQIRRYYERLGDATSGSVDVCVGDATDLTWLADGSVDYVFTDPPFGANLFYADCNLVWEAWLDDLTDQSREIVVNRSKGTADGGKTIADYGGLLTRAFVEMRRVLKPGGRVSVVFHNSDDAVWEALLAAAEDAGLVQQHVALLDKVQRSMKGYKGRAGQERVPFYDLIITFGRGAGHRLNGAGELAVEIVDRHLESLDRSTVSMLDDRRSLEYLYSLTVAGIIGRNVAPEGLSYRAFEVMCDRRYARSGRYFSKT